MATRRASLQTALDLADDGARAWGRVGVGVAAPAPAPSLVAAPVFSLALALVALLAALPSSVHAGQSGGACSPPLRVQNKSFQQLGPPSKFAYVWVDDIGSKLFGGFDPFDIFVVTGTAYSPFQAVRGPMERGALMKLTSNYNARRSEPLRVTPQNVPNARLPFTDLNGRFYLKVLQVEPSTLGKDVVTVQLCR
jgi:hypothetical protein